MVILVLGSFHLVLVGIDVFTPLFGERVGIEAASSQARVGAGLWLLYGVLLVCVEFHASVGLYRLAVKWGAGSRLSRRSSAIMERVLLRVPRVRLRHAGGAGRLDRPAARLPVGVVTCERIETTDVLVIGGGLAGERCAIEAATAGLDVILLSIVPPRRSHSCAAQGGMQAALGNCVKAEGDDPTIHFLDTVKGSDWGADQEVARIFAEEAPVAVRELAHWGVPWTRVRPGRNTYFVQGEKVEIDEKEEKAGLIMHRNFGGTAKWRACYASAGTGHAVLYAVDGEVVRLGIDVRDRVEAVSLIHEAGRCWGAVVRCLRTGRLAGIVARATVIATGGHGRIYGQYTTNATINEGTGSAIALRAGVPLGNMEAVQFHPTGLMPSGILVTEGCRGDGGHLLNREGSASWWTSSPRSRSSRVATSSRAT